MFDFSAYYDHIACITPQGERLTYLQLQQETDALCRYLHSGNLSFILCENTVGSLLGYVVSLQSREVCLLLNAGISYELLLSLIKCYQPVHIWLPADSTHIVSLQPQYTGLYKSHNYCLLQAENGTDGLPADLAVLLTTSGSTGSPKLVRLSKRNLLSNALSICEYLHIDDQERPVTSLPMYYSYGLSVVNSHLLKGATLLLTTDSYIERSFWDFAATEKATSFAGVPYTYEILKKLKFFRFSLPCLKTLTQAGGKLSNELIEYFSANAAQQGKRFVVMYGQTEATARMSYLPPDKTLEKLGSVGIAIPGGIFQIEDNQRIITSPNTEGELVYQGANVCLGYASCKQDLFLGDENQGVLHTGDIAYQDADGYCYIVGRLKRFLKLYGNRVSLDYTENLLYEHFEYEFACVGTDNKMIIYTTANGDILNEILTYLSSATRLQRAAFEVRHIDTIPHSESGKILYNSLSNV